MPVASKATMRWLALSTAYTLPLMPAPVRTSAEGVTPITSAPYLATKFWVTVKGCCAKAIEPTARAAPNAKLRNEFFIVVLDLVSNMLINSCLVGLFSSAVIAGRAKGSGLFRSIQGDCTANLAKIFRPSNNLTNINISSSRQFLLSDKYWSKGRQSWSERIISEHLTNYLVNFADRLLKMIC